LVRQHRRLLKSANRLVCPTQGGKTLVATDVVLGTLLLRIV
jgi:hypothetical protein